MGALERPRQSDGALSVDDSPATGGGIGQPDEAAARRSLRVQIARLERELADAFVTAFPMGPAQHRFARISCRELGEPGCGVWQVRPRLGLIGMLMGWWQVKLSSGCPLPGGHAPAAGPVVARS
jgi:hypothetical protein